MEFSKPFSSNCPSHCSQPSKKLSWRYLLSCQGLFTVHRYFVGVVLFLMSLSTLDCKLHKSRNNADHTCASIQTTSATMRPPHWAPGPAPGALPSTAHLIVITCYGRYYYYHVTASAMLPAIAVIHVLHLLTHSSSQQAYEVDTGIAPIAQKTVRHREAKSSARGHPAGGRRSQH